MKQEQHPPDTGGGNSAQIATHVWYSLTREDKDF